MCSGCRVIFRATAARPGSEYPPDRPPSRAVVVPSYYAHGKVCDHERGAGISPLRKGVAGALSAGKLLGFRGTVSSMGVAGRLRSCLTTPGRTQVALDDCILRLLIFIFEQESRIAVTRLAYDVRKAKGRSSLPMPPVSGPEAALGIDRCKLHENLMFQLLLCVIVCALKLLIAHCRYGGFEYVRCGKNAYVRLQNHASSATSTQHACSSLIVSPGSDGNAARSSSVAVADFTPLAASSCDTSCTRSTHFPPSVATCMLRRSPKSIRHAVVGTRARLILVYCVLGYEGSCPLG